MPKIEWAGEVWEPLAQRALWWPRRRTLVLADPHFGKAAAFRNAGIAVPSGTSSENIRRLDRCLVETGARRLVILGDFYHARGGVTRETVEMLSGWRARHRALEVLLLRGNHDLHAGGVDPEWDFDVRDEPVNEPGTGIWWRHFPEAAEEGFVLAGHTHPAVTLRDTDGSAARLPCFHFAERVATLPAFGAFTGSSAIRPAEGDQVVVTAGEAVVVVQ